MPTFHEHIYLDTCAVIVAHKTGCWNALTGSYQLHTVEECMKELGGGNPHDRGYMAVDQEVVSKTVTVHSPTKKDIVAAQLRSVRFAVIDAGERDLLAWCAAQNPSSLFVVTGDKAAIHSACQLGLDGRLCSLEELANAVGSKPKLPRHFTKEWLSGVKTDHWLGALA